jgi:hypothetical protein
LRLGRGIGMGGLRFEFCTVVVVDVTGWERNSYLAMIEVTWRN